MMKQKLLQKYTAFGAAVTVASLHSSAVFAQAQTNNLTPVTTKEYNDQSFSTIFERIATSFGGLPGLISMFIYLIGIIMAIAGVMKIKDHVEDPGKTELKHGAIRLIAGGALLALPTVMTMMASMIGNEQAVSAPVLNKATFNVK